MGIFQFSQDPVLFFGGEFPVLVAQRIDGRVNQELGDGKLAGKSGQRENSRVIFYNEIAAKKVPDLPLGIGNVDMATPDPFPPEAGLFSIKAAGWGSWMIT